MKKNIVFLFSFSLLIMLSCSRKIEYDNFPETHALVGEKLNMNNNLGRPYYIKINDNHLVIRDDQYETKFTIFNIDSLHNVSFIGHENKKLINPGPILIKMGQFFTYDNDKKKFISFYESEPDLSNSFLIPDQVIFDVVEVSDSIFLAVGVLSQKRFALINRQGNVYFKDVNYPITTNAKIPDYIKSIACLSKLTINPNCTRIAAATQYGELLQIFEIDLDIPQIKEISRYEKFLPEFSVKEINNALNYVPSQKTRWGYLSIASNEKQIYALYSGKLQKRGVFFDTGSIVHVFDWDGNCLKKYQLDRDVLSISLYDHYIYALYKMPNGEYDLIKYPLI
jgi:hypothetical protein